MSSLQLGKARGGSRRASNASLSSSGSGTSPTPQLSSSGKAPVQLTSKAKSGSSTSLVQRRESSLSMANYDADSALSGPPILEERDNGSTVFRLSSRDHRTSVVDMLVKPQKAPALELHDEAVSSSSTLTTTEPARRLSLVRTHNSSSSSSSSAAAPTAARSSRRPTVERVPPVTTATSTSIANAPPPPRPSSRRGAGGRSSRMFAALITQNINDREQQLQQQVPAAAPPPSPPPVTTIEDAFPLPANASLAASDSDSNDSDTPNRATAPVKPRPPKGAPTGMTRHRVGSGRRPHAPSSTVISLLERAKLVSPAVELGRPLASSTSSQPAATQPAEAGKKSSTPQKTLSPTATRKHLPPLSSKPPANPNPNPNHLLPPITPPPPTGRSGASALGGACPRRSGSHSTPHHQFSPLASINLNDSVSEMVHQTGLDKETVRSLRALMSENQKLKTGIYDSFSTMTANVNARIEEMRQSLNDPKTIKKFYESDAQQATPAPTGRVTIVFTDIQDSTLLWESNPQGMQEAIRVHNNVMRDLIRSMGGYEVKTEGDAFMVAFRDVVMAVEWALSAQTALLEANWPQEMIVYPSFAKERGSTGQTVFRGARVRMGVHTGMPSCEDDPTTGRMDYFGPMVNKSARVSAVARGGQIVLSCDSAQLVRERIGELIEYDVEMREMGRFALKGIRGLEEIVEVRAGRLKERVFVGGVEPVEDGTGDGGDGGHGENDSKRAASRTPSGALQGRGSALDLNATV